LKKEKIRKTDIIVDTYLISWRHKPVKLYAKTNKKLSSLLNHIVPKTRLTSTGRKSYMLWGVLRNIFSYPQSPHPIRWMPLDSNQYEKLSEFKIVTFNMLAPCYKRLAVPELEKGKGNLDILRRSSFRESSKDFVWKARARQSIDFFNAELFTADIIALQEFWLEEEYASLFYSEIAKNGYQYQTLQRSGSKSDSVALLTKRSRFEVVKIKNIELSRFGDRVALLLWLKFSYEQDSSNVSNIVIANTHLSFPHCDFDKANQMEQMKTLTGST
jgi:hypothetical protein